GRRFWRFIRGALRRFCTAVEAERRQTCRAACRNQGDEQNQLGKIGSGGLIPARRKGMAEQQGGESTCGFGNKGEGGEGGGGFAGGALAGLCQQAPQQHGNPALTRSIQKTGAERPKRADGRRIKTKAAKGQNTRRLAQ